MSRTLLWLGLILALGVPNALIARKEAQLRQGSPVLLELGTRDPRSLIQGDYMTLTYPMQFPAVVRPDASGIARFVRPYDGGPLAPGERAVKHAPDSFLFQEGMADHFARARYAELRVTPSGEAVLVGLRDERMQKL